MKRLLGILKKYPVILGIVGSFCVIGIMSVYELWTRASSVDPKYVNQDLQRGQTIEKINRPEVLAEYLADALKARDIDKALRGFAIDETIINASLRNLINTNGKFYTEMSITPSGHFDSYNEMSTAELAGQYSGELQAIWDYFPDIEKLEVKSVDIVEPDSQLTKETLSKSLQFAESWGGEGKSEMMVLLEYEQQDYLLGMTVNHYEDYWKIFDLGSELSGTTADAPVREVSREEYKELKGSYTIESFLEELAEETAEKKLYDEDEPDLDVEDMMLPPNYIVLNPLKEDTPEKTIEKFILSIEKTDLCSALAYLQMKEPGMLEQTTAGLLQEQEQIVDQVKKFCYGFLDCDYQEGEDTLEQIGKSASKIVEELDPQYFMYFDWSDILLVKEQGDIREYLVCSHYEGNLYAAGFTLQNNDGWQILSLSSETAGLNPGENRKITEAEYEEIIDTWSE